MRLHAALAALVVAPLAAVAQTPPPTVAEATAAEADWSFGAGVSFGVFVSSASLGGLAAVSTGVPVVAASLERRLSDRTWLVLGGAGAVSRDRVAFTAYGEARADSRSLYLTAGVRRVLTRAGAPVDVSILALGEAGVADADQRSVLAGSEALQEMTSWLAGASAGIAVDRELTGGLSLRVASPLLGVTYARSRYESAGQPAPTASSFSVRALLAPRLELRLAF
jgi:hypothetical protein